MSLWREQDNPYRSPREFTPLTGTVDRDGRNVLVAAINRYLDGETTAFQFDDEILSIKSDDPTISHVVPALWCFYDDCKDHKVQLSKEAWDYFQRLILVLQSDGHIEANTRRRWSYTHLVALAAVLLFICAAHWLGFGMQLFALAVPFGLVSIAISGWRDHKAAGSMDRMTIALTPFSSLAELIPLRRSVPSFRKRKYPSGMKPFSIRTPLEEAAAKLHLYASWLLFSPLVLAFQALPTPETETRVVVEAKPVRERVK